MEEGTAKKEGELENKETKKNVWKKRQQRKRKKEGEMEKQGKVKKVWKKGQQRKERKKENWR